MQQAVNSEPISNAASTEVKKPENASEPKINSNTKTALHDIMRGINAAATIGSDFIYGISVLYALEIMVSNRASNNAPASAVKNV